MTTNRTGGLPVYVERGGECVYCPPGVATGVRMYAFIVKGDALALAEMFDRYLNVPSDGAVQFEPAGELFVLNFTTLNHVGALTPPDVERGYFTESEVAIWSLGYDRVSDTYATFVPYMVVDQGAAMAMGREVYGFPKQLGEVDMPPEAGPYDAFQLRVRGVQQWGADQRFDLHPLVDITQTDTDVPPPDDGFGSQLELVLAMSKLAQEDPGLGSAVRLPGVGSKDRRNASGPDMLDALELLTDETLPMVFLKQVRDGRMPLRACYQAVQRADFVVTAYRGATRLPGTYRIDIHDLANEPIRRDLGIPAGPLEPVDAFVVDFDFTLSVAEEIWRSDPPPRVSAARST